MVGSFGDVTCFSFYANKTITTGEGGMLVTDDERGLRARQGDAPARHRPGHLGPFHLSPRPTWEYDVVAPGFKYNLPDVAAAIGLAQLERAEDLRGERQRCAAFYYEHLGDLDGPRSAGLPRPARGPLVAPVLDRAEREEPVWSGTGSSS